VVGCRLRPAIIGQTEAYNAATVIVSISGGLVLFGAVGLFIGPVVLGAQGLLSTVSPVTEEAGALPRRNPPAPPPISSRSPAKPAGVQRLDATTARFGFAVTELEIALGFAAVAIPGVVAIAAALPTRGYMLIGAVLCLPRAAVDARR